MLNFIIPSKVEISNKKKDKIVEITLTKIYNKGEITQPLALLMEKKTP